MSRNGNSDGALSLPKKLIVCCDGTWSNSNGTWMTGSSLARALWASPPPPIPTNVTRLARAIKPISESSGKDHGSPQIIYYQAGVGSVGNLWQHITGGALGNGLGENVREAYSFLATNYVQGDEIYLLGYSRGAYTARAVGGFMSDFGLLNRDGLSYFYDIYSDWINTGVKDYKPRLSTVVTDFRIQASATDEQNYLTQYHAELRRLGLSTPKDVTIEAIGVFETVGALGIPTIPLLQAIGFPPILRRYRFFDTRLGSNVANAFQALALNEHRASFMPTVWENPTGRKLNMIQVWFPGGHGGVGGGDADNGIADISLAWMMSQLSPFIDFYPDYLRKQYAMTQAYLTEEKVPKGGLLWGASQLHDSLNFFFSLGGIAWRTPGCYYVTDRLTDRQIKSKPLVNTNEHIHVAVRSREKTGGLNLRNKISPYEPRAMQGYALSGADAEPGQAFWTYEGKEAEFRGKVLKEAELGVFEKEIFQDYVTGDKAQDLP